MKRNIVRLAVIVTAGLLLCAGLTQAAPTERAPSVQSVSSRPTPAPPVSGATGSGPTSSPTQQPPREAAPPVREAAPSAAAGPNAPAIPWNRVLSYTGNVFKPRGNDVSYNVAGPDGGCVFVTDTMGNNPLQFWSVPLILPDGAQIQAVRMIYYDADPATVMHGYLTVYNGYGQIDANQEWVVPSIPVQNPDTGYNFTDLYITPPLTVDYSKDTYVINWQPGGMGTNLQLCGFRVYYYQPMTSFMPFVSK